MSSKNRLFVINKPAFISSNYYLTRVKRKFKEKKAGFSGTLDPFAVGTLITAFGQYTKLFRFLEKTPKRYRATLWIGAVSQSYDTENIISVDNPLNSQKLDLDLIKNSLKELEGEIEYVPPKYSAKKINGRRAYELIRENRDVNLKKISMNLYNIELINYNHPFITFEATVSEGSYIRSLGQILAKKLNVNATLSYLNRLNEGKFIFDNHKSLNPINYLNIPQNIYSGDRDWFHNGKRLHIDYFETKEVGFYYVLFDDFFGIVEIENDSNRVKYILNRVLLDWRD